MFFSTVR